MVGAFFSGVICWVCLLRSSFISSSSFGKDFPSFPSRESTLRPPSRWTEEVFPSIGCCASAPAAHGSVQVISHRIRIIISDPRWRSLAGSDEHQHQRTKSTTLYPSKRHQRRKASSDFIIGISVGRSSDSGAVEACLLCLICAFCVWLSLHLLFLCLLCSAFPASHCVSFLLPFCFSIFCFQMAALASTIFPVFPALLFLRLSASLFFCLSAFLLSAFKWSALHLLFSLLVFLLFLLLLLLFGLFLSTGHACFALLFCFSLSVFSLAALAPVVFLLLLLVLLFCLSPVFNWYGLVCFLLLIVCFSIGCASTCCFSVFLARPLLRLSASLFFCLSASLLSSGRPCFVMFSLSVFNWLRLLYPAFVLGRLFSLVALALLCCLSAASPLLFLAFFLIGCTCSALLFRFVICFHWPRLLCFPFLCSTFNWSSQLCFLSLVICFQWSRLHRSAVFLLLSVLHWSALLCSAFGWPRLLCSAFLLFSGRACICYFLLHFCFSFCLHVVYFHWPRLLCSAFLLSL